MLLESEQRLLVRTWYQVNCQKHVGGEKYWNFHTSLEISR